MSLPLRFPFEPMEAEAADQLPTGPDWLFEPKWDGFRCLAFRDGDAVRLQSKAGKPLTRYFPDVEEMLAELGARRFVLEARSSSRSTDGCRSTTSSSASTRPRAASRSSRPSIRRGSSSSTCWWTSGGARW